MLNGAGRFRDREQDARLQTKKVKTSNKLGERIRLLQIHSKHLDVDGDAVTSNFKTRDTPHVGARTLFTTTDTSCDAPTCTVCCMFGTSHQA